MHVLHKCLDILSYKTDFMHLIPAVSHTAIDLPSRTVLGTATSDALHGSSVPAQTLLLGHRGAPSPLSLVEATPFPGRTCALGCVTGRHQVTWTWPIPIRHCPCVSLLTSALHTPSTPMFPSQQRLGGNGVWDRQYMG